MVNGSEEWSDEYFVLEVPQSLFEITASKTD